MKKINPITERKKVILTIKNMEPRFLCKKQGALLGRDKFS